MPLSEVKQLIRERLGLRFEGASERHLRRALEQRVEATVTASLADYLSLLRRTPAELNSLATLLTINETYFDREPHHLDMICEHLLPRLLANQGVTRPVRILSLGCSSGEEPYSVAIRVHERWGQRAASLVQITGADVDQDRIRQARIGCYQGQAFRALAPERKQRWFRQQDLHRHCLRERIRNAVGFHTLNVLDESLAQVLGPQHIVLYRNISIYFDAETRAQALRQIKHLLHPEGYLIVGTAEVLANDIGLFAPCLHQGIWYFAKESAVVAKPADLVSASRTPARRDSTVRQANGPRVVAPASGTVSGREHAALAAPEKPRVDLRLRYERALTSVGDDQFAAALAELRHLPPAGPSVDGDLWLGASLLKAGLLLEMDRLAEAEQVAHRVLEQAPWSAAALALTGRVAQRRGDPEAALARARRAVYAEPNYWPAHLLLGELYRTAGETALARRAYAAVLNLLNNDAEARRTAGPLPLPLPVDDLRALCRAHLARLASAA